MKRPKRSSDALNRKDHYSPQGYLRGFIHPERERHPTPLWVLDVVREEWVERSTSQIGWQRGFYDYPPDSEPDATAEDAFRRLERLLPRVRRLIRAEGYDTWIRHREVLVSFAAMLTARSPLFRSQSVSQVLPSLGDNLQASVLARNFSITLMRTEIERRAREWQLYDWVLGYTRTPEHPFVTSDQGVGMRGNASDVAEALDQNDFWLWCPVSWDMCMVASSRTLKATSASASELRPEHVSEIQTLTRQQAARFVASPRILPSLTRAAAALG
jgi:hypothetical protein